MEVLTGKYTVLTAHTSGNIMPRMDTISSIENLQITNERYAKKFEREYMEVPKNQKLEIYYGHWLVQFCVFINLRWI